MNDYDKFAQKRKELQRLRRIYKGRVKRAKDAGLYNASYLSQINPAQLGYNSRTGEDWFSLETFYNASSSEQRQMLAQIDKKINSLQTDLNNKMSSIRGIKYLLKQDLNLKTVDMNSPVVQAKITNMALSPEGWYKRANVQEMMDMIDARTDLTDDEKKLLKKLIRERLSRKEKVDYADWILEWDFDIDDALRNPKELIDRLSEGIPDDVIEDLMNEAETLSTTDNPSRLPF